MDYIHHILSVLLSLLPCLLIYYSKLLTLSYFFGCGLPGGITYYLLILVKYNKLSKLDEKRYTGIINAYFRCPGIILVASLEYIKILYSIEQKEPTIFLVCLIISYIWNACFFNYEAIYNYAYVNTKEKYITAL